MTNNNPNRFIKLLIASAPSVLVLFIVVYFSVQANDASAVSLSDKVFNPLGTFKTKSGEDVGLQVTIGRIIGGIIGLAGVAALGMFVYGGVLMMFARGNSTQIELAKKTLVWSVLGLFAIFSSYAVLNLVLSVLGQ